MTSERFESDVGGIPEWESRRPMLTGGVARLKHLGPRSSRPDRHISSRRRMRSSIGGCVENSFSIRPRLLALDAGGLVEPQVRRGVVRRCAWRAAPRRSSCSALMQAGRVARQHRALRVREVLAVARDRQLDQLPERAARGSAARTRSRTRSSSSPLPRSRCRRCSRRRRTRPTTSSAGRTPRAARRRRPASRRSCRQDVAVDDVRHLVTDDALQLDAVHRARASPG